MREWFKVEAAAGKQGGGEILIYSHIGKRWAQDSDAVDAKAFVEALQGLVKAGPGDIHIRINSPGGDVGAGMTIYNALRSVNKRVVTTVEGYAYSMASVIALAGRETRMADTAQFMVHNPTTLAYGGQKDMERAIAALKTARTTLVKAYTKKTGKPVEDIEALMDETTFMTADEAKEFGFVDVIVDGDEIAEGEMAACFDAGAWAAYWMGAGPMPVEEKGEEGGVKSEKELDGSDGLETGGNVASDNDGAEAPLEVTKMSLKLSEIEAACEGASAEFILAQSKLCEANEERTIVDVLKAHNAELAKAVEAERAGRVAAEAAKPVEVPKPQAQAPGVEPLSTGGGDDAPSGDPVAAWHERIAEFEKRGLPRAKAISKAAAKYPEIHAAFVRAHNEEYGRPAGRFVA